MKTIWFVLRSSIHTRRPVISIIQNLLEDKNVKIKLISIESLNLKNDVVTEYILPVGIGRDKFDKIKTYFKFRSYVNQILKKELKEEDYIWLGSLDTINACLGLSIIRKSKYICHIHELYDTNPFRLKIAKNFIKDAYKVVVPELNRARILQVWLSLRDQPTVYPNKPFEHPRQRYMKPTHEITKKILSEFDHNKKIIIYQGHISKDRSLEPIIEAIKDIDNIEFWLMGTDHNYVTKLLSKSEKVKYLGYVPAPYHLEVTSYANIGIMSYDLINLNNLYCAPNKVWEYLGFDLYFICNKVGSLDYFVSKECCKLTDFRNSEDIRKIIIDSLNRDHDFSEIYDEINLKEIIKSIL